MSDQVNPQHQANPAPKMTALSTAYPMQFESTSPASNDEPRRVQPQPTRAPHRHDAGE